MTGYDDCAHLTFEDAIQVLKDQGIGEAAAIDTVATAAYTGNSEVYGEDGTFWLEFLVDATDGKYFRLSKEAE